MSGLFCLALGMFGKTSPFCYCKPYCLFAKAGKWLYEANVASYESIDTALYGPPAGKNENLFIDSLTQVCEFLQDLIQDVGNTIIGNDDVWKNEEVKSLVALCFKSTSKTLDFLSSSTMKNCIKKAQNSLHDLRVAIKTYETESECGGGMTNKYAETLEKLNKVTNIEDPFGDDFVKQLESLLEEHEMILEKIGELQVKFAKKHKNVKTLRKLTDAIFLAASASSFVISVVTLNVGPSVHSIASDLISKLAEKWVKRMMNNRGEGFERQIQLLQRTEYHTKVHIQSVEKINGLVGKLRSQIKSITQTVDTAVQNREEEAMKLTMQKLTEEVNEFEEQVKSVGEKVASCRKCVTEGESLVQTLMNSPRKW